MDVCVDNANRAIFNAAHADPQFAGMGTTLVVGVFRGGRLLLGHIGDSRGYRWREGHLVQLTRDHSLLQEQIDAGLISPEQAARSPQKNLVTRAVGVEDVVLLEAHAHAVHPDDWFLLCSDGLSDMLDDSQIAAVLSAYPQIDKAAPALIDAANQAGGRDNIAVILVAVHALAGAGQAWWPFRR
jgi:protein phosphatase